MAAAREIQSVPPPPRLPGGMILPRLTAAELLGALGLLLAGVLILLRIAAGRVRRR